MYNKYYIPFLFIISTLPSCIGTNGLDYYSKEAYAARGAGTQDIAPPPYSVPPQPQNQMMPPVTQGQVGQMQQNFQAQQQAFAVNNTSNYSQNTAASRNVNQTGDQYMVYLTSLSDNYYKQANYFASKGLNSDATLLQAKADSAKALSLIHI